MTDLDLLNKVASAIEKCGWEDVDIADMYIVMAEAAISTVQIELQVPTEAMKAAARPITTDLASDLWIAMLAASPVALEQ
ncbi:hypothetical protein ACWGNA_07590 [Brucella cytisi]|jgi:hypothetical protein|uniref:Uncharacterized protein n=1 Tax=Brucella cytisi TaxID=407152 RepID=A0A1J6HIK8_9HYPH|nr:hypothetical protein [Brucella cytisi]NKC51784.1 hypothetical protein [Brucella cytisi]OIS92329.1 hypothetical protein BLA27_16615 [Brucella cytisi]